jgi:PleD family two-component response regulator
MAQGQSISELFAKADAAVYLAKNAGRDQVRSQQVDALRDWH